MTHPKLGITKDLLATRILPSLIPISVDSSLNMSQFNSFIQLIKEMLSQVECEHRKKLEQIELMDREKSIIPYSFINNNPTNKSSNTTTAQLPSNSMMDQLMITYGVDTNDIDSKRLEKNNSQSINTLNNKSINRQPLTLEEKHEAAKTLQKEHDLRIKSNKTENLMDSNLVSFNKLKTEKNINNLELLTQLHVSQNHGIFQFNNNANNNNNNNNNNNDSNKSNVTINPIRYSSIANQQFSMNPQQATNYRPMLQQSPQRQTSFFDNLLALPSPTTEKSDHKTTMKKSPLDDLADLLG